MDNNIGCQLEQTNETQFLTTEGNLKTMRTLKCQTHDSKFHTTKENPNQCINQKM